MSNSNAVLLSLILIFLSACSDPTIEFGNLVERGGVYYEKFSTEPFSGRVVGRTAGMLKDGRLHGLVTRFYSNGDLAYESQYDNGILHGRKISFGDRGQIRRVQQFHNGKLVEYEDYRSTEPGNTRASITRINGEVHHTSYFHRNGALQFEISYRGRLIAKGRRVGNEVLSTLITELSPEGDQIAIYPIRNNRIHGVVSWIGGEFKGCKFDFVYGLLSPLDVENRGGGFISDEEAERRMDAWEIFTSKPCYQAVRSIPCPLCHLNNHSDLSLANYYDPQQP